MIEIIKVVQPADCPEGRDFIISINDVKYRANVRLIYGKQPGRFYTHYRIKLTTFDGVVIRPTKDTSWKNTRKEILAAMVCNPKRTGMSPDIARLGNKS